MVAQVAADDPETAAKIVQPMMLVCRRRPGTRSSHGARPRNMSSDNRVRNKISPIQTNRGNAVSVHDEAVPQIVTAIASPAGRDEKSSMPIHATPASASPMCTPVPSSTNSATISSVVISASMGSLVECHDRWRRRIAPAPPFEDQLVDERDREDHGAGGHRELRNPQRRRVAGGGNVVEVPGLIGEAHAEDREQQREQRGNGERPELER